MDDIDFDVESISHLLNGDFVPEDNSSSNNIGNNSTTSKNDSSRSEIGFNSALGGTWIYPTNFPLRDYQYKITYEALLKNTMVNNKII